MEITFLNTLNKWDVAKTLFKTLMWKT